MSLHDIFALLIGSLTLSTAVMVVFSRNAVYATIYLLLTLLGVACEFVLLQAHFLAIAQVLVYAGSIAVLMVFVMMMVGFGEEHLEGFEVPGGAIIMVFVFGGILVAAGGVGLVRGAPLRVEAPTSVTSSVPTHQKNAKQKKAQAPVYGSIKVVGKHLITHGILAFEVIAVMLLMAIIGIMMLLRERRVPVVEDDGDL